jgi:hypothetical protein
MRQTRIGETMTTAFRARGVLHVCVKTRHRWRLFHDVREPRPGILLRISQMKKSFTPFPPSPTVPLPDARLTFVSAQDHRPCLHTSAILQFFLPNPSGTNLGRNAVPGLQYLYSSSTPSDRIDLERQRTFKTLPVLLVNGHDRLRVVSIGLTARLC